MLSTIETEDEMDEQNVMPGTVVVVPGTVAVVPGTDVFVPGI